MPDFVTVARVGQIPEGRGRTFHVGDRDIVVFFEGGQYFALDDYCPHMGESLGLGRVCDGAVICDRHHWAFNLCDGSCADAPTLKAQAFAVRVQGEEIQVQVSPQESR